MQRTIAQQRLLKRSGASHYVERYNAFLDEQTAVLVGLERAALLKLRFDAANASVVDSLESVTTKLGFLPQNP